MVRAENNTIFGSVAQAKTAECAVCGKRLKFKEEKQDSGTFEQAKHCGRIYTVGQSSQATITMGVDPEYKQKEDKVIEKQREAKEAETSRQRRRSKETRRRSPRRSAETNRRAGERGQRARSKRRAKSS